MPNLRRTEQKPNKRNPIGLTCGGRRVMEKREEKSVLTIENTNVRPCTLLTRHV